jgi:PAS domain S-box-containing protein
MKKLVNYLPFVALFLLPLLFYPVVDTSSWRSSSDVHAMLEFASSLLAITAGIMVLLYFFTTGRSFFLIISIGFVLIGAEEFVHAIFSFNRIWVEIPTTFKLAISTTWLSGQFILVTSFFIALLSGERHVKAKRGLYAIVFNIIGVIFASSISLLIFNSPFLPDFVQLGSITKKMTELSLALLFFVAFIFYFRIYLKQQSHSSLLWGIIACIILRVLVHIFVFDSRTFYDSHWDTAHLIVLLSYFPPIFGVWGETIKLHRFSQLQVIELEKEMTERKQTEETLRESEEKFRNLFNNSEVGMFRTRLDGSEILEFNKKYLKILNYTFEEVKGSPSMNMWANKHEREKMVQLLKTEGHVTDFECELLNKQGDMINCVTSLRLYPDNGILEGSIQDITERKQAEEEIKNIKESLEMLNHRLEEIREDERALISRELHDQLGQSLTALKIDMNWLCGKIASDSEESAKLKRMIKLVTDTSKDVHRISTELRPAM